MSFFAGRKRVLLLFAVFPLIGIIFFLRSLLSGPAQTEEAILMGLVERMAAAAEERKVKEIFPHLSPQYKDLRGRTADDIKILIKYQYLRGGVLSVFIAGKEVSVDRSETPLRARMEVRALLTQGTKVKKLLDIMPDSARALIFDLSFIKDQEVWKLISADWRDVRNVRDFIQSEAEKRLPQNHPSHRGRRGARLARREEGGYIDVSNR